MGYAGNIDPEYVIPTVITDYDNNISSYSIGDNFQYYNYYNYYIGDEAIKMNIESSRHSLHYPIQRGIIENWDMMEKFWNKSFFSYLKCDPQEHYFMLTTNSLFTPEKNNKKIAEIFFETYGVPGLFIGPQSFFSFMFFDSFCCHHCDRYPCYNDVQRKAIMEQTGVVVDIGEEVTNVFAFYGGFVINVEQCPFGGRTITQFMEKKIRERGEIISNEDLYYATIDIKEQYGYVAFELLKEYSEFDKKERDESNEKIRQSSQFLVYKGIGKITKKPFSINLGYELFLGPELLLSPRLINIHSKYGLVWVIDNLIQKCPIECRKQLYSVSDN